ncbi:MAG: Amuc_1102 family pilus-like protein, partial [Verrucomicrobiota bacterium]
SQIFPLIDRSKILDKCLVIGKKTNHSPGLSVELVMFHYRFNALKILPCIAIFGLLSGVGVAQSPKVTASCKAPVVQIQKTPQYSFKLAKDKPVKAREWIEIEVPFSLKASPKPKDGFLDSVTVDFYVVLGSGKKAVEKGSVIYKNVPVGEPVFGVMYISPDAWKRALGKSKVSSGDIAGVGIEIQVGGKMVGFSTKGLKKGAWRSMEATSGALMSKSDTPFAVAFIDRYPSESK